MIRIEGIPVVALRLRQGPGQLISPTKVRGTSRLVAIGKALIAGIRAALQTKAAAAC
jgi:hypothetical protein